jgi:hypothetical protein
MIRMLCVFTLLCGTCMAGDTGDRSVLVTSPAPTTIATNCCDKASSASCDTCTSCPKVYNVTETCNDSCRKRILGGYVKKTSVRKVYRPAR